MEKLAKKHTTNEEIRAKTGRKRIENGLRERKLCRETCHVKRRHHTTHSTKRIILRGIGYSNENLTIHTSVPSTLFPSPPLPFISLPSPNFPSLLLFPSLHSFPSLRSRSFLFQLGGLEEHSKIPQRGLGPSPSQNRF